MMLPDGAASECYANTGTVGGGGGEEGVQMEDVGDAKDHRGHQSSHERILNENLIIFQTL